MKIRRTTEKDLDRLLWLFQNGRNIMRSTGNHHQWINGYPQTEVLKEDINLAHSYVCVDENEIVGTCCYFEGVEPTYSIIDKGQWLNNLPYGVIHRITSCKKGVGSFMIEYFYNKCKNLRIDTHNDNIPMRSLLNKLGFTYCGIIYLENGDERVAYQKCEKSSD